ncbi:hypothetical protein BLNAU_18867 [Blattamonas nauphoetae]|uniref:Uncharacterized protein n=1 Tax=Blattamonas nauphoetae TaxID=2049346 RepID=A0ABQ9X355_9EUKA|nr:hypothetical protein BLNAU_18867 [Blattamonas nauphoetae]
MDAFLNFDVNSELSLEDQSSIYCSLIALVKAEYPFDTALQDKAVHFLKNVQPDWREEPGHPAKLVTDLAPSTNRSPSGFVESILTLLSSPHSTVVDAALSFLRETISTSSSVIPTNLVESDLISNVFATVQPHTLPISINETIFQNLILIITDCINLANPYYLRELGITSAADTFNHREMIFQKVVLPSSQFVTFLITNRNMLHEDLFLSFVNLLSSLIVIGPFHQPTLEFVLASPIVIAFSNCHSYIEREADIWFLLYNINNSLKECKIEGPETVQSGKRIIQALISEGFEDTLEQMMLNDTDENHSLLLVQDCLQLLKLLGSNVELPED